MKEILPYYLLLAEQVPTYAGRNYAQLMLKRKIRNRDNRLFPSDITAFMYGTFDEAGTISCDISSMSLV